MSEPISRKSEAPRMQRQLQIPGDAIQQLQKAVKALQTSVDILSARSNDGNKSFTESDVPAAEEKAALTNTIAEESVRGRDPLNAANVTETVSSPERITQYKKRCAKHRRECEKMQMELGCLITHLSIVGGEEGVIENAKLVHKHLLGPVQSVEQVLDVTGDETQDSMRSMEGSFLKLLEVLNTFWAVRRKPYNENLWAWMICIGNESVQISKFIEDGKLSECLEYVHKSFFSYLETAMSGFIEALMDFEEKSANKWLAEQKLDGLENLYKDYITCSFQSPDSTRAPEEWIAADTILSLDQRDSEHTKVCKKMQVELDHLIAHYERVGGFKESIDALRLMRNQLLVPVQKLCSTPFVKQADKQLAMFDMVISLKELHSSVEQFRVSLYRQKHAFYFRMVKQWAECLSDGMKKILAHAYLIQSFYFAVSQSRVFNIYFEFFPGLESTMIGQSMWPRKPDPMDKKFAETDAGNVVEEMKTFGKESLPKFLVDEMERDTTRYINLTTIATFFSSVTATTLQFTYAPLQSEGSESLRGVVNLFWLLSLVFSVSSGVSSLLGLTWRKSSIYDSCVPPKLIRIWLDKAPMLFLIIAAVAFAIGLNLFAYLSLQPRYVSFSATILTGIHGMCLLTVTAWFIYQLKHESIWAGWIRTVILWVKTGMKWIWKSVKWPYKECKQNLHFRRNIYWAFGFDNRVAKLNYRIGSKDWNRDWPEPYLLSKHIRCIAYPVKKGWIATKTGLTVVGCAVRKLLCVFFHTIHVEGDVESGEKNTRKDSEEAEETFPESLVRKAKSEFRRSLASTFSDAALVEKIMKDIWYWELGREESAEKWVKKELWGYPDLLRSFFDDVRPALVEAREDRKALKEKEEQELRELGHIDTDPPHSMSDGGGDQDMYNTASVTEIEVLHDSQAQPDDDFPRPPFAVVENIEEPVPTTRDASPRLDAPGEEESQQSRIEIDEAQPTPENHNGRSQSNKESGE